MTQPWENCYDSRNENRGIKRKIKNIFKVVPIAVLMVGMTYTCFIYMSLVKRNDGAYNTKSY